jgi:RimJ/RimL family protein N-acetyltransferase
MVLEKLGFNREGTLKKHVLIDGKLYDSILHLKFINT